MRDPRGGLRVLVADDNADAARTLAELLEMEGHWTRVVFDGLQAVGEATRERYDAVVLDLSMPVIDGFEAAALLARLRPAPALIACSAWDDGATRKRTSQLGFVEHLSKPVAMERLQGVLRRVEAALRPFSRSG